MLQLKVVASESNRIVANYSDLIDHRHDWWSRLCADSSFDVRSICFCSSQAASVGVGDETLSMISLTGMKCLLID